MCNKIIVLHSNEYIKQKIMRGRATRFWKVFLQVSSDPPLQRHRRLRCHRQHRILRLRHLPLSKLRVKHKLRSLFSLNRWMHIYWGWVPQGRTKRLVDTGRGMVSIRGDVHGGVRYGRSRSGGFAWQMPRSRLPLVSNRSRSKLGCIYMTSLFWLLIHVQKKVQDNWIWQWYGILKKQTTLSAPLLISLCTHPILGLPNIYIWKFLTIFEKPKLK